MTAPTRLSERIPLLDVIRGVALCGILLANLTSFVGAHMLTPEQRMAMAFPSASAAVLFAIDWLIEGKFYSLFSILLGAGFVLQRQRTAQRNDAAFGWFFRRRMLVLAAFGAVHMTVFWFGDILLLYGVMGLALPTITRWSPRAQLRAMALLFAIPILTHAMILASDGAWDPRAPFAQAAAAFRDAAGHGDRDALELFVSDDMRVVWTANLSGVMQRPGTYLQAGRPTKVLALFLLGAWLAVHALPAVSTMRRPLWLTLFAGSAVGLPASFAYARIKADTGSTFLMNGLGFMQTVAYNVGTTPLALAYLAGLALLWASPRAQNWLRYFAPLGRMALTVYLLQTIVQLALFSGYGWGLAGRTPFVYIPAVALVILTIQQRFCVWWLSQHAQGPMEWLWRRLTYSGPPGSASAALSGPM